MYFTVVFAKKPHQLETYSHILTPTISVDDVPTGNPYGVDPYGVNAWDGGWAFYAGSLEGTEVGGSIDGGVMLYALAEEMCETFGTCTGDSDGDSLVGISEVNVNLLSLWQIGQAHLEALECADAAAVIHGIVRLMAVPLVQGLLRCVLCAVCTACLTL